MTELERILTALANPSYRWRTIAGLSKETGIPESRVRELVEGTPDKVIRSRIPDAQGRPLYTTRAHYKQTHTAWERLVDQVRSTST